MAQLDQIRSEFVEKVGLIVQGEGRPKTAGRLFGLLVLDGDIVSFGDLATQLLVRRASISSSGRMPEECAGYCQPPKGLCRAL